MAKSFLVSPGRAYLVIAGEGTKIVRTNGSLIDTVPEGANNVSITVDTHEIIVMDNAAKIQQLYNGNSGSSGVMMATEGEEAGSWKVEIVSTLPEQGSAGIIYMLRTNRTGTDRYDDYIWIPEDNAYELLGRRPETTSVDLSNVAKTNAANTFSQPQRVNNTLYATQLEANSIDCETRIEAGSVSAMDVTTSEVSAAMVRTAGLTVQNELVVADNATIQLPGMEWRRADTQYIYVDRTMQMQDVNVDAALRVSNMLTLGSGGGIAPIELNGAANYLRVQTSDGNTAAELTPHSLLIMNAATCVTLAGDSIALADRNSSDMPAFSVTLTTTNGGLKASTNGDLTMNGVIAMPGTLNVNNLNVTGTVTGINTGGGGGTPTVDFSNGVTIMEILTADDVIADTVTASTLSAGTSLSVASESVIYKHSDGAIHVHGDIVNATQVTATTFIPTNIQGATFTGPLVMSKDNSLLVWNQGNTAEIRNGNITGFYYAQFDHCTVTHALSADSAKINRASVTDTLVVKDLVVTGTTTGIPTGGGGGSGTVPDPLSVTNLSANAAEFGAVTVTNTLTVPDGVYFSSTIALKNSTLYPKKVNLLNPDNEFDNLTLAAHEVECTVMTVTDFNIMGGFHASKMWCLELGSDHATPKNPIYVQSPLWLGSHSRGAYDGGCIELKGGTTSETDSLARFGVDRFIVTQNPLKASDTVLPMLVMDNTYEVSEVNSIPSEYFNLRFFPSISKYSSASAMLELSGRYLYDNGQESCQHTLRACVSVMEILAYESSSPIVRLVPEGLDTPTTHTTLSIIGTLAHYTGGDVYSVTSFYMDRDAAYYCGGLSDGDGKTRPIVYINPNADYTTNVRALYSYHTNPGYLGTPPLTTIPGLYSRNMLCATSLTAGVDADVPKLSQLGVNMWGTYIQKPIRALDSTSDITGLYYKPVTNTILPNLWQELVTSDGRPLSSVSEYTLEDSIFGLLSSTAQHPDSTSSFPNTGDFDNSSWEVRDGEYNICVSSVEFGFSTGANGLTLTWPSQVIWPDEPDRLPPTQFQPNMCYRFVARMEPIPDPNSRMFNDSVVTYKWVILVSQTYSYPNPWATT